VTKQQSEAAAAARVAAGLGRRKRTELLAWMKPVFTRTEAWLHACRYTAAVMSDLPRRNGWTIAKLIGDKTPDRKQRLLSRACWDEAAAMSCVRRFAVTGLDQAVRRSGRGSGLAVGALDETGQEKHGTATAGVQRQHMGCAGGVENGINTVHLSYVREGTGHALIGARQWIPAGQIADPVRSLTMALPLDLQFATKGQLARAIVCDALGDGVIVDFVCGDEACGSCTQLRGYLEEQHQAYVLRVPSSFRVSTARAAEGVPDPARGTQYRGVNRYRCQREHQARDGGQEAERHGQAHAGHAYGDCPAEDDHLAVQADAVGDHGAQAQQGGEVEHIRSDDDPGAQTLLVAGHRGDGRGDLGRVRRERGDNAQQGLRQAEPLAHPLEPRDKNPACGQAYQRPGQERRHGDRDRHRGQASQDGRAASAASSAVTFPGHMPILAPTREAALRTRLPGAARQPTNHRRLSCLRMTGPRTGQEDPG
jgi:hypothetical protein